MSLIPSPLGLARRALPALVFVLAAVVPTTSRPDAATAGGDAISASNIAHDIRHLASDDLAGRRTGERGAERAAEWLAREFQRAGLAPAGDGGTYLQHFQATVGVALAPGSALTVRAAGPHGGAGAESAFAARADFIPFAFSDTGTVEGEVVFAGYGITAPELHYDDYAGLDATGRIVLLLRHEPQEEDSASVFAGRMLTQYADFRYKLMNARAHGATGVLIATDPLHHAGEEDDLVPLTSAEGVGGGELPAAHVKSRVAGWMARAGCLGDLVAVQAAIDRTLTPHSAQLCGMRARLRVALLRDRRPVANVVGSLRGRDTARAGEFVVIGAHYDHLGRGGAGSLAHDNEQGKIHHGADDNASGTAGVLALARDFGARARGGKGPARSLFFIAFTGEEEGLLGSGYYVNHPIVPLERTAAMINMDMIGRLREGRLTVSGLGSSPGFRSLVDSAAAGLGLSIAHGEGGYGPSDQTSFYARRVPVLFFFTGAHADYHRPTDTADKINAEGETTVLTLVSRLAGALADRPGPVVFTRAAADSGTGRGSEGLGGVGGYGSAYLGTIPDFEEFEGGVKLTGVREESPAERAGIRGGDVIVSFAGKPIKNLYDLTYALRAQKPGDTVEIGLLRGAARLSVTATLGKRR